MGRIILNHEALQDYEDRINSDPVTAISAARMMAELENKETSTQDIVVTVYDKFCHPMWEVGDYSELNCNFPRNQVPTGRLKLPRKSPAADTILKCDKTTVPITIQIGLLRWSGRVKVAHDNFNMPNQGDFVECELEGDYAWLTKILAWPNFLAPLQVQFPPRGLAIGPAISVLKWVLGTQAFRLQSGIWDLVNDLFSGDLDWHAWFSNNLINKDAGIKGIMNTLRTPIYVVPTNPLFDTSPFISVNWRMDKISSIFEQQLEDNGLVCEVNLWLPGDPQPDNSAILKKFPLKVPTIVVDIKDREGVVGRTGTFLDGIMRTLVDVGDAMFGEALRPFLNPKGQYAPYGVNIAPRLGLNFIKPWAVFMADDPRSGIWGKLSHHTPECWRVIIGGKSPAWMNQLMDAFFSWILDMIMIVVGLTGIPSNLFDGLFNDVLMAFQLADNYKRRLEMGPYGYPEVFIPGAAPYNIDAVLALAREMFKTRGYVSGQCTFRNGVPYEVGRDLFPGALASIIRNGYLFTDYIYNIVVNDTRQERADVFVQIGDGKMEEPPATKVQRRLANLMEAVNILTLANGNS